MPSGRIYAPNRIKELRRAAGLTLDELGAAMPSDLTGTTISKLEGRRMALSADYLIEIAHVLGVSPGDILGERAAPVRILPVAGRISAGNWREAVELADDVMPVPANLRGDNLFVLRPEGDSMDLVAPGGVSYIVVNPDDRELIDGRYYVVMNGDGEATFKRFCASPLSLQPCSSNPAHKPITIGGSPFTVIGRVIYVGQEL